MSLFPQKCWPSRRFWLFTLGLCAFPVIVAKWRGRKLPLPAAIPYRFPSAALEELDFVVQARFAVVPDNDFGVSRIGERHGYFAPLSTQERKAIANLQKSNQEVLFYVVGRNTILRQQNYLSFSPVQEPIYITPHYKVSSTSQRVGSAGPVRFYSPDGVPGDLPADAQLVQISRSVFKDAALREGTNGHVKAWNVVGRPITATSQACVNCHNARAPWKNASQRSRFALSSGANKDFVALNDTLGIALYCYRTAREGTIKELTPADLNSSATTN